MPGAAARTVHVVLALRRPAGRLRLCLGLPALSHCGTQRSSHAQALAPLQGA